MLNGTSKIRACIIGAGAAGLVCVRHLSERRDQFVFDVFEQTGSIGGIWNYSDTTSTGDDGLPVHSAVYKSLKTNLPMEMMEFPDFPSKCDTSFVGHTEVLKYLQDYAEHYSLKQYINFYFKIIKVSRTDDESWSVSIENLKTKQIITQEYDAVYVCNGKYGKPKYPSHVRGLDTFTGSVIHSHDYRVPDKYKNKTVLILGGGPSASDILVELSNNADHVIVCHLNDMPFVNLPANVTQENSTLRKVANNTIELCNGKTYDGIDEIIFATGYHCNLDFLDESCELTVNQSNKVIDGLYLYYINTTHPSMCLFQTIQRVFLPFNIFHQQALLFIKSLTKEIRLPSKSDMDCDTERDQSMRESMGIHVKYPFYMFGPNKTGKLLFDYSDKLCTIAGISGCRPVIKRLYNEVMNITYFNMISYRDTNFKILSDYEYVVK